jgi:hypothetical protein
LVKQCKAKSGAMVAPICNSFQKSMPIADGLIAMYNPIGNRESLVIKDHAKGVAAKI